MNGMPTWEGFMVPCLKALSDGSTHSRREMAKLAADIVGLSDEQRGVILNSAVRGFALRGWGKGCSRVRVGAWWGCRLGISPSDLGAGAPVTQLGG